jgi:hypothetical protein
MAARANPAVEEKKMPALRRALAVAAVVSLTGLALPALADPPGPGDKQCIPGLNAPPQPGKKGGTCPGHK